MSKLGKELAKKGVKPITGSDGKRLQCPHCRSKALEANKDGTILCHACNREFSK